MTAAGTYVLTDAERERVEKIDLLVATGDGASEQLIAQLAEPSWTVRRAVVAALAALGEEALAPMIGSLRGDRSNETVLAALADALVASRGDVEAALAAVEADANPAVVADVAQVLGRRQHPSSVPVLVKLSQHQNDNVAVAAIEGLGRIGGRAAVEPLIAAATSGNFFRVFPAIDVLGRSSDPRAVAPLASLLDNRHYALEATRALGRTGDRNATAPLTHLLLSATVSDVRVAAEALAELRQRFESRFGTGAPIDDALRRAVEPRAVVRRLSQALDAADASEKMAIARVLGMLRDESVVPLLTSLLNSTADGVSTTAAESLKGLGRKFEDVLLDAIRHGDAGRRKLLLPLVTNAGAAAEVVRCLEDDDAEVRAAACDTLGRLGNASAVRELFAHIEDPNPAVVQAAVGAIQSIGGHEAEALALAAARGASSASRRWGLRILAYFGSGEALDVCLTAVEDPDPMVRDSALFALPFIDDPRAREALFAATRAAKPRTRAAGVRALGQCTDDILVQSALLRALTDSDSWVRYYAAQSLGRLGAEAAAEPISRLLADEAGQVRVAAVEALSYLKNDIARRALAAAAQSADEDVQRAAFVGLGIGARPESLPLLLEAAASVDGATRLVVFAALASYSDPRATEALAQGAADRDEGIRNACMGFLSGRRDPQATSALVSLVRVYPTSPRLQEALAAPSDARIAGLVNALRTADDELAPFLTSALARMARPEALVALREALVLPQAAARKAAAMTLGGMGSRDALEALRMATGHDPDPEVRRIAALGLT